MKNKRLKKYTLDQVKDQLIGTVDSPTRVQYELELEQDLIGEAIKQARKKQGLTQAELGDLIGVQKAQISKLENGKNGTVTIATIQKVFAALNGQVRLSVEFG